MITLLKSDDYWSQRNNKISPMNACMPTSRVMYYTANRINYVNTMKDQYADDDYFMYLLNTDNAKDFRNKKYPSLMSYSPNEIHGMMNTYLDPIVAGHRTSDFKTDLTYESIVSYIKKNVAIMTSGSFAGRNGPIAGHAFVFVGLDDEGSLLIADPYGNFHTNYMDASGYLISMNKEQFLDHVKPVGSNLKQGHVPLGV